MGQGNFFAQKRRKRNERMGEEDEMERLVKAGETIFFLIFKI